MLKTSDDIIMPQVGFKSICER